MLNTLMILNLTLLIVHQIDAAYWHEWDMFLLPGGIQLFNVINILIFVVLLRCFLVAIERRRAGFIGALVVAGTCGIVFPIHAGFALAGFEEFHLPVSIAVIVGCGLSALAQILLTLRSKAEFVR